MSLSFAKETIPFRGKLVVWVHEWANVQWLQREQGGDPCSRKHPVFPRREMVSQLPLPHSLSSQITLPPKPALSYQSSQRRCVGHRATRLLYAQHRNAHDRCRGAFPEE